MRLGMPQPGSEAPGAHTWARAAVCATAFISMGLSVGIVGPLLPFLVEYVHLRPNGLSACFVARGLGGFVGSIAGGLLTDRLPGHHVVVASLSLLACVTALIPSARSPGALVFLFLLFDLAIGGLQSCNALISWTFPDSSTSALNALNGCFGIGTLLSPLLSLGFGEAHWRWAAVTIALLIVPCACLAYVVPSPRRIDTAKHSDAGAPLPPLPRRSALVALTVAFLLCVVGAETTLGAFLVTYVEAIGLPFRAHAKNGREEGDILTTTFWISFTAGRLLMGVVAARLPPRRILACELGLLVCSITLVLAAPASRAALYIGVIGCGAGLSGCFGGAVGQASELIPLTGRVTGMFCAGAVAGVALVQLAASQAARSGPRGIIATVAAASYAAAVVMGVTWLLFPSAPSGKDGNVERDALLGGEETELAELEPSVADTADTKR